MFPFILMFTLWIASGKTKGSGPLDQMVAVIFRILYALSFLMGYAVAQLVEALRYKLEGDGLGFRCGHWNFSLTIFWPHYDPGVKPTCN